MTARQHHQRIERPAGQHAVGNLEEIDRDRQHQHVAGQREQHDHQKVPLDGAPPRLEVVGEIDRTQALVELRRRTDRRLVVGRQLLVLRGRRRRLRRGADRAAVGLDGARGGDRLLRTMRRLAGGRRGRLPGKIGLRQGFDLDLRGRGRRRIGSRRDLGALRLGLNDDRPLRSGDRLRRGCLRLRFGRSGLGCRLFDRRLLGYRDLDGRRKRRFLGGFGNLRRVLLRRFSGCSRLRLDGELVGLELLFDRQLELDLRLQRLVLARLIGVGAGFSGSASETDWTIAASSNASSPASSASRRFRTPGRRRRPPPREARSGWPAPAGAGGASGVSSEGAATVAARSHLPAARLSSSMMLFSAASDRSIRAWVASGSWPTRRPAGIGAVRRLLVVRVGKGSPGMFAIVH